ncbi:MAG: PQQ-binding-like beta-propeller repeat protein [Planctomyces sp.]|nr:PQQ-binding-like beta-propeller repeat protein [Planctomyces sp.]
MTRTSAILRLFFLGSIIAGISCVSHANRVTAEEPGDAGGWTEFLGSGGNGFSNAARLPTHWSETENVRWKVDIAGMGWSSPVVSAGRIFLTTAVSESEGARHSLRTICIDSQSGKEIWNVEVFRHAEDETVEIHGKNSHASPTPIVEGDRLYVHFGPHGTACLSTDGQILWKNTELKYLPQHGNGGSPAVAGDLLIICCDGKDIQYVVGLKTEDGSIAWKVDRDTEPSRGFSFATPAVIHDSAGELLAVCPGSSAVFCYNAASGKEVWRVDYGEGYSVVPRPIFQGGMVYVCSGFGDEQLLAIDPKGTGNITSTHVRWSTKKATPKSPSPILVHSMIFMVSDAGVASCLDAETGKLLWQERLGGNFSASPIATKDNVYFQSETGTVTVVKASPNFELVAKNQIGDGVLRTFATPAVDGDGLLLRSETSLYRIEQESN